MKSSSIYVLKKSKIHGKGLFALKDIKKGTKIIEYIGEIISKDEGDLRANVLFKKWQKDHRKGAVYIFELDDDFDLDGGVKENTARFINHSCKPNCKYKIEKKRIWIISIKDINKGEELTYDYGYDFEDHKDHKCNCGAKDCVGYIIQESERKKLKK